MIDKVLDWADPQITEVIWTTLLTYFGWIFRWIFRTRESRDALHRAIGTGVDKVTDLLAAAVVNNPLGYTVDQFAGTVTEHVYRSVPDALKFLMGQPWFMRLFGKKGMSEVEQKEWIEGMAVAKLRAKATEIMTSLPGDVLTNALHRAEAPVVVAPPKKPAAKRAARRAPTAKTS